MADPPEVTRLLLAWSDGDTAAGDALLDAIYGRLRQIARAQSARERSDLSLPPTALVHEAYLTLIDQRHVRWQNRVHFFAIAARVMRRILVDHARARMALKRGAHATVALVDEDARLDPRALGLVALDVALEKLGDLDTRAAATASSTRRVPSPSSGIHTSARSTMSGPGPLMASTPSSW